MLIDPSGKLLKMDTLLPYFKKLPLSDVLFKNYIFPGIALLIVNGITNLTAAAFLFARKKTGIILGTTFGFTLMLWICIQFYAFPSNPLSISYFFFGLAQFLTGYATCVFYKQENFIVHKDDYKNISKNKKELVVCFSRMGYIKKIAYETADKTGADIYEIKSTEKTEGTLGFWWCGRFGMHKWDMPICEPDIDMSKYEKVTICTPIWAFNIAAPVRSFCRAAKGKIKKVDFIIVHFQKCYYSNAINEMNELLGTNTTSYISYCNRRANRLYKRNVVAK